MVFLRVIICHLFLTTKITRKNSCKFRNCKCCGQVCFSFVLIWALLTGICYLTSERFLGMLILWVWNWCNCHAICSGRLVGYWAIVRVDKMIVQSESRTAKSYNNCKEIIRYHLFLHCMRARCPDLVPLLLSIYMSLLWIQRNSHAIFANV